MSDECGISLESDGEGAEFYTESERTARKAHTCCECKREIARGARYVVCAGKADGQVWSLKVCLACMRLIRTFSEGRGFQFGDLWDVVKGAWEWGQPVQSCINRVSTVVEKTKLRDEWLAWKAAGGKAYLAPTRAGRARV